MKTMEDALKIALAVLASFLGWLGLSHVNHGNRLATVEKSIPEELSGRLATLEESARMADETRKLAAETSGDVKTILGLLQAEDGLTRRGG